MEHRLITGESAQWLPFARSCVAKLKRLGLPYASQSFEIDGASIKVRIEPGHEYIRIEGEGDWYSIFPRSKEHIGGITTILDAEGKEKTVTPYAIAQPTNKVQLHKHYQTGRFDWVSFDGYKKDGTESYGKHLITFDGDTMGRYPIAFDPGFYVSWVDMQNIVINGKLAVFSSPVSGIAIKDIVLEDGTVAKHVVYATVLHRIDLTSIIGFYSVPLSEVYKDVHVDKQIGGITEVPGKIRQPIYFDGLGNKFVSFFTTYLGMGVTTTSVLSGQVNDVGDSVSINFTTFDTLQKNEYHSTGEDTAQENEYEIYTVSNHYAASLLGIDLTPSGKRVELTVKTGTWNTYTSWAHVYVGGQEVYFAGVDDNGKSGTRYYMGDKEFAYFGAVSGFFGTYGNYYADYELTTNTTVQMGLYDVDLRYSAAAWIAVEYGVSTKAYFIPPPGEVDPVVIQTSFGSAVNLNAVFGDDAKTKVVRSPGTTGIDHMLLEVDYKSKMIASRKDGEYMVCVCIPEAHHTDRPWYGAAFSGVDLTPLAFGKKKGRIRDAALTKLGLDKNDTAITYTPITLIYSKNSLMAAP